MSFHHGSKRSSKVPKVHFIDLIASACLILGALYGAFVGPILAATTLIGLVFAAPFLYWFQPIFFNLFSGLQDDKLAYLLFFPIGYLVIIFCLKATALRLDAYTKKMWLGGKHFWGTITGIFISSLIVILVTFAVYPFAKELSQKSFNESNVWTAVDTFYKVNPDWYTWTCNYFKVWDLKNSINKFSEVAPKSSLQIENQMSNVTSESDDFEQLMSDHEATTVKQNQIVEILLNLLQNRINSSGKTVQMSHTEELTSRPDLVSSPEL